LQDWKHLSGASSLCGACTEACPVKIDLHHHLLHNRRNAVQEKAPVLEQWAYRIFAFVVNRPGLYQFGKEIGRWAQPFHKWVYRGKWDPARAWTATRDTPALAEESFKEWWRNRR
jgi:L-lactate dehydrogenase complex protein LldF